MLSALLAIPNTLEGARFDTRRDASGKHATPIMAPDSSAALSIHNSQYLPLNMSEDDLNTIPGTFEYDLDEDGELQLPANVEQKHQWSLVDFERTSGVTGWVARKLLSAGDWIERELDERRQTIGGMDNLWLLLTDAADFNPVCACTYTLRGKLPIEQLRDSTERQTNKFPKYRQRLTSLGRNFHGARFEDDPTFDSRDHIHTATLPEPAGRRELDELMGKFIAQDWDFERPLWEMVLVSNYHDEDGAECAIITRGHHSLADGQGFVISQLYMTSYHDDLVEMMSKSARKLHAARRGQLLPSQLHHSLRVLDPFSENVLTAPLLEFFLFALFWLAYATSTIISLFWSTYQAAHQAILFLLTWWRVDMLSGYQPGPRVSEREFSSSRTFSMADVRACQQAFSGAEPGSAIAGVPRAERDKARNKAGHVTLNDVVCAVMADVLAREIAQKPGNQLKGPWTRIKRWLRKYLPSPIGFFIPISIRAPGDWSMRNLSTGSLVYLDPAPDLARTASVSELHAHIHRCRGELSLLKHSLWPRIIFHIIQLTGQAPVLLRMSLLAHSAGRLKAIVKRWITKPVFELALQSFPVVLTNVPGPAKKPVTLDGVEVIKWTALPPQAGKGTIGMGIISYAGGISIAVAADRVPISRDVARRICEGFEERFEFYVIRAREVLSKYE
ncbi:hypothetical protein AcV7_005072 [Taiwanofungus camphoratus]|nr:hypothetical protein AcV7_005072 [Antrodia cinnamomea]